MRSKASHFTTNLKGLLACTHLQGLSTSLTANQRTPISTAPSPTHQSPLASYSFLIELTLFTSPSTISPSFRSVSHKVHFQPRPLLKNLHASSSPQLELHLVIICWGSVGNTWTVTLLSHTSHVVFISCTPEELTSFPNHQLFL